MEPAETGVRGGSFGAVGGAAGGLPHPTLRMDGRDVEDPGHDRRGVERDVAERPVGLDHLAGLEDLGLDGGEPDDRLVLRGRDDTGQRLQLTEGGRPLLDRPRAGGWAEGPLDQPTREACGLGDLAGTRPRGGCGEHQFLSEAGRLAPG
ncbi:hypothetical protein H9L10_04050 [Phycicoccus endophyticus]|uniref:Uncharacterized protein n=1 Tax=Phycicoccus endophyticus TaxID=1690220 RepID=A0A7G9R3P9_9MICO|nr:hypothetical protein [Phycicoccus endophyticus]QNN50224.1 hypothetical protein H9L10_04050 [Phycicoccus endophyticus]GGL26851.1 hypothetical protein GCM10012283_06360 [Phycicoccus endophyticus]